MILTKMGAGFPNWAKLYEMGKLPKSGRNNVPMLAQMDKMEKEFEKIAKQMAGKDELIEKLKEEIKELKKDK